MRARLSVSDRSTLHCSSGVQEVACGDEVDERKGSSRENDECVGVAAIGLREVDPHATARALHNATPTMQSESEGDACTGSMLDRTR